MKIIDIKNNSDIDLLNYYIEISINGVRTFAPLSGVLDYSTNNNNAFVHTSNLRFNS